MSEFRIKVNMDNAAFENDGNSGRDELARILRAVAHRVGTEPKTDQGVIRDANGNNVGTWEVYGI